MIRVSVALACIGLASLALPSGARADGFDGAWLGGGSRAADCGPITFTLSVQGDALKGQVSSRQVMADALDGTVKPDGSFTAKTPDTEMDGKFDGGRLSGKARLACGTLDIYGQKAP